MRPSSQSQDSSDSTEYSFFSIFPYKFPTTPNRQQLVPSLHTTTTFTPNAHSDKIRFSKLGNIIHWSLFWVYVRFDYEGVDPRAAFYLMRDLEAMITDKAFTSQKFAVGNSVYSVEKTDNFEYIDPVDGSVSRNQVSDKLSVLQIEISLYSQIFYLLNAESVV